MNIEGAQGGGSSALYGTGLTPYDDALKIKLIYTMCPGLKEVVYMGGVIDKKSTMNAECLYILQPPTKCVTVSSISPHSLHIGSTSASPSIFAFYPPGP